MYYKNLCFHYFLDLNFNSSKKIQCKILCNHSGWNYTKKFWVDGSGLAIGTSRNNVPCTESFTCHTCVGKEFMEIIGSLGPSLAQNFEFVPSKKCNSALAYAGSFPSLRNVTVTGRWLSGRSLSATCFFLNFGFLGLPGYPLYDVVSQNKWWKGQNE